MWVGSHAFGEGAMSVGEVRGYTPAHSGARMTAARLLNCHNNRPTVFVRWAQALDPFPDGSE